MTHIETGLLALPHGIELSVRAAGDPTRPVLLFLHGFPQGAFVWDDALRHFANPAHGGFRCVAPNLRGYERSSAPQDVQAYRAKHLVQDIAALIDRVTAHGPTPRSGWRPTATPSCGRSCAVCRTPRNGSHPRCKRSTKRCGPSVCKAR